MDIAKAREKIKEKKKEEEFRLQEAAAAFPSPPPPAAAQAQAEPEKPAAGSPAGDLVREGQFLSMGPEAQPVPGATEADDFLALATEELFRQTFESEEADGKDQKEFLCFMLSDEEYGLDIMDVKEIIKLRPITDIPRVPEFILGIISLRGTIVPLFDLRRRLNLETKDYTKNTRVIIVQSGTTLFGMIVDKVTNVARIPAKNIEPPPAVISGIEAEFLSGLGRFRDRMIIIMNLQKITDFAFEEVA